MIRIFKPPYMTYFSSILQITHVHLEQWALEKNLPVEIELCDNLPNTSTLMFVKTDYYINIVIVTYKN